MIFHRVKDRCAFSPKMLGMPITRVEAISALAKDGFEAVDTDQVEMARSLIGKAEYRRGAKMSEAPGIVDCGSLIKWAEGERGVWLPRNPFSWMRLGKWVEERDLQKGDFVFTTGHLNRVAYGVKVGHVGIATGVGTIVHATNRIGVEELAVDDFLTARELSAIRRIAPEGDLITFVLPEDSEIETSDDIEWLLASRLGLTEQGQFAGG